MKLDLKKTAVLTLDIQNGIVAMFNSADGALVKAVKVVDWARKNDSLLLHVGIGFDPGYPEISAKNSRFISVKERGLFLKGSESSQFHQKIFKSDDTVIYKHRVSGFAGSTLQMVLHSKGIENLVLFGFATSGIVLSTLRQASDLDFNCVVIKDACGDRDDEVHRVLTEKVFAAQAAVLTADEFIASQS